MTPEQIARLEKEIGQVPKLADFIREGKIRESTYDTAVIKWLRDALSHESARADRETSRADLAVQGIKDLGKNYTGI